MDQARLLQLAGVTSKETQLDEILREAAVIEGRSLEELQMMLDAAKRGIGVANTLQDPIRKKYHLGKIFSNLNRIRAALGRMIKEMGGPESPLELD